MEYRAFSVTMNGYKGQARKQGSGFLSHNKAKSSLL